MKASAYNLVVAVIIAFVLAIIPPNLSMSQETKDVEQKIESLIERTDKAEKKINSIQVVEKEKDPPKEKVIYKTKTKTVTKKVNRKVLIKADDIYFEIEPSMGENGEYIIDLDVINKEKKRVFKRLGIPKKRWIIF